MALAPDAPRLEDWITLTEAADVLGVTKQAVHKMVANRDIKTLHQIGNRPIYIVSEHEISSLHNVRTTTAEAREVAAQRKAEEAAERARLAREKLAAAS